MPASAELAALCTTYFAATDALDHAQWASLFTPDGSFTAVHRLGEEPFFVARGHDQLRSVLVNNEQFPRLSAEHAIELCVHVQHGIFIVMQSSPHFGGHARALYRLADRFS
jgi:hypothetical protein